MVPERAVAQLKLFLKVVLLVSLRAVRHIFAGGLFFLEFNLFKSFLGKQLNAHWIIS